MTINLEAYRLHVLTNGTLQRYHPMMYLLVWLNCTVETYTRIEAAVRKELGPNRDCLFCYFSAILLKIMHLHIKNIISNSLLERPKVFVGSRVLSSYNFRSASGAIVKSLSPWDGMGWTYWAGPGEFSSLDDMGSCACVPFLVYILFVTAEICT